jgi:iron transport multicopper oxidase
MSAGLIATIIEAPDRIGATLPTDHVDACVKQGIPKIGNAAGNTGDLFNLTGANTEVQPVDNGAMFNSTST